MYQYRKLKGRIKELYGSQAAFAEAIGMSHNTVCKKLTGRIGISQCDVERWAELLKIERCDYGEYFYT